MLTVFQNVQSFVPGLGALYYESLKIFGNKKDTPHVCKPPPPKNGIYWSRPVLISRGLKPYSTPTPFGPITYYVYHNRMHLPRMGQGLMTTLNPN